MRGFMSNPLKGRRGRWLVLVSCGLASCIPEYRPPSLSEPHAVVKVRLAYHAWSGPQLDQVVWLGNYGVKEFPAPVQGGEGVVNRPVLVRPGKAVWNVHTAFFHTYMIPLARGGVYPVRVVDAVCDQALGHLAAPEGIYLLQYDFFANERCSLHCFKQVQQPDGTLGNTPCEPVPPAG